MSYDALTVIYKAVVLAKILHAITAWWCCTALSDRHGIEAWESISGFINVTI